MASPRILVVVVAYLLIACQAFDWSSYLSEDLLPGPDGGPSVAHLRFSKDFPPGMNIPKWRHFGHLYRKEETGTYTQLTIISLESPGVAWLPVKDVAKEIAQDRHQPSKWNKYRIAYRCYLLGSQARQMEKYIIKSAPIEEMTLRSGQWVLSYTEDEDSSCRVEYGKEESLNMAEISKDTQKLELLRSILLVERGSPLTRAAFEGAFPSKAQLRAQLDASFLFIRNVQTSFDETKESFKELVPRKDCQVKLYPNGKAKLLLPSCAEEVADSRKIDASFGTFLLPYRCFKSANPDDYELLNATITGIAREDGENVLYFKAKKTEHCRINWNTETQEGEALPESDYLPEGTVPLAKDNWKGLFNETNQSYLKLPFTGTLVEIDASSSKLVPILSCMTLLMTFNQLIIILPECMDYLAEKQVTDPKLSTIALAYRCFLSRNPDHFELYYEVHTARISDIEPRMGPNQAADCYMDGELTDECAQILHFAAYIRPHCHLIAKVDSTQEMELSVQASAKGPFRSTHEYPKVFEGSSQEATSQDGDYLPSGTVRLSKERHEGLCRENPMFPDGHLKVPYMAYVYERDQKNLENKELMPVWKCLLGIVREGEGIIASSQCSAFLTNRQLTDPKLSSLALVYRCFHSRNPHTYESMYELHTAPITAIGPLEGVATLMECAAKEDEGSVGSCTQKLSFAPVKHPDCFIIGHLESPKGLLPKEKLPHEKVEL